MMARTEFRWNITEDFSPVNYWIWRDVVANIQVAPFYEVGIVANKEPDLWKADKLRHVGGIGLHLISASGMVYRADYAYGDEGGQPVLFVHYSW
jgi:outer membrane translocation and assembly module TamA